MAEGWHRYILLEGRSISVDGGVPFLLHRAGFTAGDDCHAEVVNQSKSILSRHGIPDEIVSDNGPQYSSHEYATFAKEYGFRHVTSSPKYPQANGESERAVKTVKSLLQKGEDPYLKGFPCWHTVPLHL